MGCLRDSNQPVRPLAPLARLYRSNRYAPMSHKDLELIPPDTY